MKSSRMDGAGWRQTTRLTAPPTRRRLPRANNRSLVKYSNVIVDELNKQGVSPSFVFKTRSSQVSCSIISMDLRLPPLPDLPRPNLSAEVTNGSSSERADSAFHANCPAPHESLPPYLEKLLHLQKLQDQAFGSFRAPLEQCLPMPSLTNQQHAAWGILSDISGADLAPNQGSHSSTDHRSLSVAASSASTSFLEVDEQ
jgi:hypothetical protein